MIYCKSTDFFNWRRIWHSFSIFLFHYFLSDEDRSDDDAFTINFLSDVAYNWLRSSPVSPLNVRTRCSLRSVITQSTTFYLDLFFFRLFHLTRSLSMALKSFRYVQRADLLPSPHSAQSKRYVSGWVYFFSTLKRILLWKFIHYYCLIYDFFESWVHFYVVYLWRKVFFSVITLFNLITLYNFNIYFSYHLQHEHRDTHIYKHINKFVASWWKSIYFYIKIFVNIIYFFFNALHSMMQIN